MNKDMIIDVANMIRMHSQHFNMNSWGSKNGGEQVDINIEDLTDPADDCGTTCCIAGWALVMAKGTLTWQDCWHDTVANQAGDILGLTEPQAHDLFHQVHLDTDEILEVLEAMVKDEVTWNDETQGWCWSDGRSIYAKHLDDMFDEQELANEVEEMYREA